MALLITKSLTIEGDGHVLDCGNGFRRGVRIVGAAAEADRVDVKFRNVTIKSGYGGGGRCIETRDGHFSLTLDHAALLETGAGNTQALTIGGDNAAFPTVTIKNGSRIETGDAGYGVITFNPASLIIDDSSITGYAALYFKGKDSSQGSAGMKVQVRNGSVLTGNNPHGAGQNSFGVIVTEADNVTVEIADSTVSANATSESAQSVMGFNKVFEEDRPSVGSKLVISGSSKIDINGELATFVDYDKAEQNTVEVLAGESTTDAVVPYMVSGRVALRAADGFRVVTPEEAEGAGALSVVEVDGQKVYFTDAKKAEEYAESKKGPDGSGDVVVKPVMHTVTFADKQFGNKVAAQVVNAGAFAQKPAELKHDGYTFLGWFIGDKAYDFSTPVMGDIELFAKWEKLPEPQPESHEVTVVLGNGHKDLAIEVVDGGLLPKLDEPSREGYDFAGWFLTNTDGILSDEFDFTTPVTSDFTLYAGWVEKGAPAPQAPEDGGKGEVEKKPGLPKTGDLSLFAPAIIGAAGMVVAAAGTRKRR